MLRAEMRGNRFSKSIKLLLGYFFENVKQEDDSRIKSVFSFVFDGHK
jgi:hypothetical protein